MNLVAGLLLALLVLAALPTAVFCLQVLLALAMPARSRPAPAVRPRLAVLMPAHNEEAVIAASIASILPQLAAGDRLLVVADNCADATAALARTAGAEVVERSDAQRRGKGYALDFGLRHLAQDPPGMVLIADADCLLEAGAADLLARHCAASGRPVQALYLMESAPDAGPSRRLAEFAWRVKNWVRPLGYARLGLPCQLTGTGMAFPWALVGDTALANGNIVEDMKLGIDLALAGRPPLFCPEARVRSRFPADRAAAGSQRTRWEHGHLSMILQAFPAMAARALGRGDGRLLALALDLAVPPLALLGLGLTGLVLAGLVLALAGGAVLPLALALVLLACAGAAVLAAWCGWGRDVLPFAALLAIPGYMAAKLPLYLRFLVRRQRNWVKTGRD